MVEVLLACIIGSVVMLGTLKVLNVSLQSARRADVFFAEQELRAVVAKVLSTAASCRQNLGPPMLKDIYFGSAMYGIGKVETLRAYYRDSVASPAGENQQVPAGPVLIQTGSFFNDNLEIIDMRLDSIPSAFAKKELFGSEEEALRSGSRRFVIFYRKNNVGKLSTLAGGAGCKKAKDRDSHAEVEDCYFIKCDLQYELAASGKLPATCNMQTCLYAGSAASHAGLPEGFQERQKRLEQDIAGMQQAIQATRNALEVAAEERTAINRDVKKIQYAASEQFEHLVNKMLKAKQLEMQIKRQQNSQQEQKAEAMQQEALKKWLEEFVKLQREQIKN